MLLIITLRTIISLIATLILTSSPLLLGLWIILLALLISIFVAISSTSWLGIIIFLIYVGGLLVIFAYFVALTPNLLIEGKKSGLIVIVTALASSTALYHTNTPDFKGFATALQLPIINLLTENSLITITLALVLFFALIAVVKLCSSLSSPLRPFN